MPKTSTGPAIWNIFAPTPKTRPSLLNSIAGETMELAKPVMGTSVPAPAWRAIGANHPSEVSTAAARISTMDVAERASSIRIPMVRLNRLVSACPIQHIAPPERKAQTQSYSTVESGDACCVIFWYSFFDTFIKTPL